MLDTDNVKLLEEISINDRTIISWYDADFDKYSIIIFHLYEQPNAMAKQCECSTWGYPTHLITNISTMYEAVEVFTLFLKDFESQNYWWENE